MRAPQEPLLERADLGSAAWWRSVRRAGTPLCRPLPGGEVELSFLWRDPMGGAARSDYRRVYLDVYSHTPHPTRALTSMARLGESDVWLWQTRLPDDWCGSYFLMPATRDELPPEEPAEVRRWWIALMASRARADALNPRPPHRGAWGQPLSAIQLPGARPHPAWSAPHAAPPGRPLRQRWRSARLGTTRDVWIYRSGAAADGGAELPLVILLDGHHWARHPGLFGALEAMTAGGELAPAVYLLVDALNPEQRARDLPCNAAFWLALQEELLPRAHAAAPFSARPEHTLVAGQSFGGLGAVYAALHWPRRFGMALSQSGSFWWPDPAATGAEGWLTRAVAAGQGAGAGLRIALEVGCYESDMLGPNRALRDALQAAGHDVDYREFRGGHDWLCWRDGLLAGLGRMLGPHKH